MSLASVQAAPGPFIQLPTEIIREILGELPNRDIKSVRLTCARLRKIAQLRLNRVFISPSPRDIEVFRAVADHEEFRKSIIEVIYDDARIEYWNGGDSFVYEEPLDARDGYEGFADLGDDPAGVPNWYSQDYRRSCEFIEKYGRNPSQKPCHVEAAKRFEARLSLIESHKQFVQLARDQSQVISIDADAEALRYGLLRFPSLKRIIITPAAHGNPTRPLYETPTIRSLPPGFIYPIPRGWPVAIPAGSQPWAVPWESNDFEKEKWRGFCLVTSVLAELYSENAIHDISEFVIDTNHLLSGINCCIFEHGASEQYDDFLSILSHPGFSRLDLSLLVGAQEIDNFSAFRSGHLKHALSNATELEHINLSTNIAHMDELNLHHLPNPEDFIPLRTIFPIEIWSNLRHFGLSRFHVVQADLINLLLALPATLRSVDLNYLDFFPSSGQYKSLLEDVRNMLGWREREAANKPKITIFVDHEHPVQGRPVDVSRKAENYVYYSGENPFLEHNVIFPGAGTWVDAFDPNFEPYSDPSPSDMPKMLT